MTWARSNGLKSKFKVIIANIFLFLMQAIREAAWYFLLKISDKNLFYRSLYENNNEQLFVTPDHTYPVNA